MSTLVPNRVVPVPVPMTDYERAVGWVAGLGVPTLGRTWREASVPREALARHFQSIFETGAPLFVAFSGGLDSSLLLAIATDTARRDGYPLPIPVTNTYASDALADESNWQRLVLRHLDLEPLWQQVPLDPRDDLVGPHALAFLGKYGVCWPMAFLVNSRALCKALPAGATLVTGDGGDEAFGQRRVTAAAALVAGHRPTRKLVAAAARGLAPRPLRRWDTLRVAGKQPADRVWVRAAARQRFIEETLDDHLREPLRPRLAIEHWARRRAAALGRHNMTILAAEHRVDLNFPLWSDGFSAALQREAGLLGWLTRGEIVERIAGDLLPGVAIRRRTKAVFNTVMFGPSAREVIAEWDGFGLDEDLVDVSALRAEWAKDVPHSGTIALLQEVGLLVAGR